MPKRVAALSAGTALAGALASIIAAAAGGGSAHAALDRTSDTASVGIKRLALAPNADVVGIAVVNGRAALLGTAASAARRCDSWAIDPTSLVVGRARAYPCTSDPAHVNAASVSVAQSGYHGVARIVHSQLASSRRVTGPVVMSFTLGSTSRPVTVSAFGSLWLYDVATTHGAELLRFSSVTGRLENRIALPRTTVRPVMIADRLGLYVGISPGGASGAPGSPIRLVRTGANDSAVVWRGGNAVRWGTADAHHAWFDVVDMRSGTQRVLRFDGAGHTPALDLVLHGPGTSWLASESVVAGDGAIWTVSWSPTTVGAGPACGSAAVLRVDERTGGVDFVARLPGPTVDRFDGCTGLDPSEAVIVNRQLYVLAGHTSADGYSEVYVVPLGQRR